MFAMTGKQWRHAIAKAVGLIAVQGLRRDRPAPTRLAPQAWLLLDAGQVLATCEALTKSHARALFKIERGIKGRLPRRFKVQSKAEHARQLARLAAAG